MSNNEPQLARQDFPGGAHSMFSVNQRNDIRQEARARAMRRVEEREHLRLELKAREYINTCHGIAQTLVQGYEDRQDQLGGIERVELSRARVQALKTAADISLRLLDRVLPPLKAVEVNDSPEKDMKDAATMSTQELLALARQQMVPLPAEYSVREEDERPFG